MEGDRAIKCGFCHLGTEVESICGKLHYDNKSIAAHHKCMQYSADLVQYKFASFGGFKIDKVEKEIQRGKRLKCSICKSDKSRHGKVQGATAGCDISKCSKTFHFYCARLDDVAITKRVENSKFVMYRVFCGEAHYNKFKNNKGALKNQHKQLDKNCSDEEQQSRDDEDQSNELPTDSQNTQFDEDILMISQMSENDHNDDRNANESSDSELEDPLNSTSGNQRVKTVNKKGDNRAVIDSKSCESDHDSDFVDDDNLRGAKVGSKTPRTCKVIYVRENSARKGKLESPKVQKTPNTKNNLTKSRAAEMPELSIPKINVGGSTKKLGRQQSVKDTATQKAENEKGKENKNGGNVRGKSGITEKGIEEGEREDSSVESSNEDYDQNLIESSDSELEDPFNSKASNKSNSEQKSPQKNVKNNSLNNSKARRGNDGEESDISGDENEVVDKGGRKSLRKSKATVGEKNTDSESNVKKGRLDTTKPNKTPVPKNSSRVLTKTTEPSASSTPKRSGRGTSLKLPVQQKIITQAELHVTTSPSSGEENSDDEATSYGVYHSSDDEPTPDPTVGEIISSSPQRATNDPERSNPAEEFSSESEWEENATFPGALKNQHKQLDKNCSDEEQQSGDDEDQSNELPTDSQNTQFDEDILMISQMSENDHNDDRNANESSDSELEDPLNSTSGNQRVKTVNKKGDNRAVIDSKSCESDHDSDFVDDDNLRGAKVGSKTPRTCKVIYVRENSARKGKLESPKVQKTPNTKNNLTKSRAAEMPELSIPKINVGGSTKKLGRQQSVKDTATQKAENEKGKENKNGGNVRGKSGITEKGIEEGEREDSSVESSNEDYDQNLIESSDSELEDPFNSKASNKSNSEQKSPQKNIKNNSLNNSKARRGNDGEESDISGDENEVVDKGGRKSLRKSKATVGEKNTDSESNLKKGRLDTTKPNKTPVPKNSSRVLTKTTEPSASSTPKRSGRGTSLKLPVQQKIITQAELHVTTSPSSGEENSDDEATSNGVYHSSDDEPTPDPTVGEIISSSPQRATNDPERSNPAEEFSSESEWEENATFPDCAIAISSIKKVWPSKRDMIPQKAKEWFDVQYAKSWSQSASFSNQLSDDHLPHIMKIVADMVRNKKFKKLGQLLTDCNYQVSQMESINHLLSLDDHVINNIRESLLDGIENQEVNGEVVLIMDTNLNTLFLKLNNTVDRLSKIRNQLFPNMKELSGCLYGWKESTVSAIAANPTDMDSEWKGINAWMNKENWNSCERCIYPAQDIFLAAVENKSIEKLIECHHSKEVKNTRKKLFFVRAMDDMVNLDMFLQKLIGSCANHREALIISHAKPPVTIKSLLPSNLRKGIEVKVMSAFKPSNKQGISVVVISVSNPNWQQQQRSSGTVPATASDDEITPCPEDNIARDRKRKSFPVKTGDSYSKRKRKS